MQERTLAKEKMNHKKLSKVLKKVTIAAMLGALAAPLVMSQQASAATYTASEYFPGTVTSDGTHTDEAYDDDYGCYFRNFKNRSANIYVKDKSLKKIFQKAAKAWSPVFKFKFVNSAKHANYNSSKYANVVVLKDGGNNVTGASVNKAIFFAGSMKALKQMHKDFPSTRKKPWYGVYADGKITNYKKWKAWEKKELAHPNDPAVVKLENQLISSTAYKYASKAGLWMPTDSDAAENSWNKYITVIAGTRGLSQAQQIGEATETLGEIIGVSSCNHDSALNDGVDTYYNYKVTQSDLDHVDWIYAHPWSGSNYFADNALVSGAIA